MKEENKFLVFLRPDTWPTEMQTMRTNLLRTTLFDKELTENEGSEQILPSFLEIYRSKFPAVANQSESKFKWYQHLKSGDHNDLHASKENEGHKDNIVSKDDEDQNDNSVSKDDEDQNDNSLSKDDEDQNEKSESNDDEDHDDTTIMDADDDEDKELEDRTVKSSHGEEYSDKTENGL